MAVIKELEREDPRVHHITFIRNFGHQATLLAGMMHSRGEVVISLDSDLQHPPELLPRLLRLWQEGYHVRILVRCQNAFYLSLCSCAPGARFR